MKVLENIPRWLAAPVLTRTRIGVALAVAVATDTAQLVLGPLGWFLGDEVLDVIAMVLTTAALGFHPLLLPTFVIEFIPGIDMLPTWTGCAAAVIMLRRRIQPQPPPRPAKSLVPRCSRRPRSRQRAGLPKQPTAAYSCDLETLITAVIAVFIKQTIFPKRP